MELLNSSDLATAMGRSRGYVSAMKLAGYQMFESMSGNAIVKRLFSTVYSKLKNWYDTQYAAERQVYPLSGLFSSTVSGRFTVLFALVLSVWGAF